MVKKIIIEYKQKDVVPIEEIAMNKLIDAIREYYRSTEFAGNNLKIRYDGDGTYFRRMNFVAKYGIEQDADFSENIDKFGKEIAIIILEREPSFMNKKIFVTVV